MVVGGSPPWHDGSGGQRPRGVSLQHRPRPPEPVTTHPRACGVLGASLAKQTHPRPLSISAVSPSPLSPQYHPIPPGSCPTSTCPTLEAQRGDVPSMSPPALLPSPRGGHGTPKPEGTGSASCAGDCDLGWESRAATSSSCGQGHTGTVGTSPGLQGQVRRDEMTAGSGRGKWSDTCQSISVTRVTIELGEVGDPTRPCWESPI